MAAAQGYGGLAGKGHRRHADQAVKAFTLIKVVGRDIWIGIWAFVLSIVSITLWEKSETGRQADAGEIWCRFPKFVIGFLLASLVITCGGDRNFGFADYNKVAGPLHRPNQELRTWAFTFSFFSIGLTTRLRELANAGKKPFIAFSAGAIVNLIVGFILSAIVFAAHWENLAH